MSGASLVNMSYGHLAAAAFPVGSPGLPTPPQMNGSPSPPTSHPRAGLSLTTSSSTSPLSSPSSSSLLGSGGLLNNSGLGAVGSAAPGAMSNICSNPAPPGLTHPHHQQQCCENGRPVMTDPHTGQTVCSCQYSSALLSSYSRLPHGLSAAPSSLFGPGAAGGPYSAAAAAAAAGSAQTSYMPLGAEGSAFYTPLGANGSNIRDGSEAWRSLGQPSIYDTSAMGFYPYGTGYGGLDLNARRKNATRESTNTLKAWLQEHIKNPYPTKGEKIMLAIITKMTLTQVSTWFANARRRLKKENKMTWSPRNRSEDGEDDDDDDNSECGDDKKLNNNNSTSDHNHKERSRDEHIDVGTESHSKSGEGHRRDDKGQGEREVSHCRLSPELPRGPAHIAGEPIQPPPAPSNAGDLLMDAGKPKIWSVSDFLGSAPHKDALGLGYPPKMDPLKPDIHSGMLGGQALIGRSSAHAHNGFGSFPGSAHHLSAYQSSLGYSPGAYPYSLSSYGGGKFLSPVATSAAAAASSRFNPFPSVKPLGINSPYASRRDAAMAREGE